MNRAVALGLLLATGVALALRCPELDLRPMHTDEAVNAIKFGKLWERGVYKYDPDEHHGPTLAYVTFAFSRLTGAPDFIHFTEARLRAVAVIFGVGLILLLPLVTDGLGRRATIGAGFLTAVSPAMVFYSRYYIHEMLLIFFAFLALAAGWRNWRTGKFGWALMTGAAVGLMMATKETFVINLAAATGALVVNGMWSRRLDANAEAGQRRITWRPFSAFLMMWLIVWLVLFSSFFTNMTGLLDSFRTYQPWLTRAGGASPHIHPWHFYLTRLLWYRSGSGPVWTEALIFVLAVAGTVAAFRRKGLNDASAGFVRFVALYSFGLMAAYSLIGYKTPWCLLSFWHGIILLAGVGTVAVLTGVKRKAIRLGIGFLMVAGMAHLAWQATQLNYNYSADRRNPYVYAHTSPNVKALAEKIEGLARVHPDENKMLIKVMAPGSDYWPLPWYLRAFPNVGWWNEVPADPFAPVMVVSSRFNARFDEKDTHQMPAIFALRPQTFMELYVESRLWRTYIEKNPPSED